MVSTVMNDADRAWRSSLRSVTIAGLVARLPGSVHTRNEETLPQLAH